MLLSVVPLGAVIYGVTYEVQRPAYAVFGLQLEDAGITQGRLVSRTGTLLGLAVVFIGAYVLFGLLQFRLVRDVQPRWRRAPRWPLRSWAPYSIAALLPLVAVVVVPPLVARGMWREEVRMVLVAGAFGLWFALILPRWRIRGFVGTFAVFAVLGSIVDAFVDRPQTVAALHFAALTVLGPTLAFLDDEPAHERGRIAVMCAIPFAASLCLAVAAAGTVGVLFSASWLPLLFATYVALTWTPGTNTALDRRLARWRSLAVFAAVGTTAVGASAWVADRQEAAIKDAVRIKAGRGPSSAFTLFPIDVMPARIVPRTGDPLNICPSGRVARLLGRNGDTAYVLLRPPQPGDPDDGRVVPLDRADYLVLTGFREPGGCWSQP